MYPNNLLAAAYQYLPKVPSCYQFSAMDRLPRGQRFSLLQTSLTAQATFWTLLISVDLSKSFVHLSCHIASTYSYLKFRLGRRFREYTGWNAAIYELEGICHVPWAGSVLGFTVQALNSVLTTILPDFHHAHCFHLSIFTKLYWCFNDELRFVSRTCLIHDCNNSWLDIAVRVPSVFWILSITSYQECLAWISSV